MLIPLALISIAAAAPPLPPDDPEKVEAAEADNEARRRQAIWVSPALPLLWSACFNCMETAPTAALGPPAWGDVPERSNQPALMLTTSVLRLGYAF